MKHDDSWRPENFKADRRKGRGRKRDGGTRRFKEDHDFREWVHKLKQKRQLHLYGVENRMGGDDNIDNKDLRILEQAYDKL